MIQQKLVSVGVPVFNVERYVEQSIRSIMNQTHENIEIIISDNCSTDDTFKIIKRLQLEDNRIKINRNDKNLGFAGNINKLIEIANSEYLAIYHADDVYENNIIEEQLNFLLDHNKLAGCFALGNLIDEKGNLLKNQNRFIFNNRNLKKSLVINLDFFIRKMCETGNIFICPTAFFKKSVLEELGGFNNKKKYIEDQDMWTRILMKYNLGIINKNLINYRIHSEQASNYYSSFERQELSKDLKYLNSFLESNKEYKRKYENIFRKRVSKEYLVLARNAVFLDDFHNFKKWINLSKKYYSFNENIKFALMQRMNLKLLFYLIKLYLIKFKIK